MYWYSGFFPFTEKVWRALSKSIPMPDPPFEPMEEKMILEMTARQHKVEVGKCAHGVNCGHLVMLEKRRPTVSTVVLWSISLVCLSVMKSCNEEEYLLPYGSSGHLVCPWPWCEWVVQEAALDMPIQPLPAEENYLCFLFKIVEKQATSLLWCWEQANAPHPLANLLAGAQHHL